MAYVKIWVHIVWTTKNRERVLTKPIREVLFPHIRENAKTKNIHLDFIGGHLEHIHCLISLNAEQTIAKTIQLIKGEAAFWFNRNLNKGKKLEWQDEYFAVSVSESKINVVRGYIKKQEEHHKKKSFQEEYEEFIQKYGFSKFPG
jgi:REP element-mobilizing transposase RayT